MTKKQLKEAGMERRSIFLNAGGKSWMLIADPIREDEKEYLAALWTVMIEDDGFGKDLPLGMKKHTHDHMGIHYDLCHIPEFKGLTEKIDPLLLSELRKQGTTTTKTNELKPVVAGTTYYEN